VGRLCAPLGPRQFTPDLAILRDRLAPAELLQGDRTYLQLRLDPAQIWCDVHHFEALLDACQAHDHPALAHCPLCRPKLQEAVQLYQAPLLASFATLDSAPFDQWLQAQRERLAARFAAAQDALTATVKAVGNLPPPLTPLVGRAQPLAYLASQLHHPRLRCLTLEGPGGIGKTRLAIALGAQRQAQFPNGVWLVALSGLAPTTPAEPLPQLQDRLAMAIAAALGLAFYGTTPPAEQVLRHLADKTALLILDSMEHLAAGAAWLPTLLAAAPHLRLLLTTRQRLPLADQLSYPVAGLDVPPVTADEARSGDQRLTHYASVQLFVERATSAGMNIAGERTTLAAVGQLCRFVECPFRRIWPTSPWRRATRPRRSSR